MGKFRLILTELSARDTPIFSFPDNYLCKCQGILTKLCTHIDIKEIWFWIANEKNSSKMTWRQLTERDFREWKPSAINPHDKYAWRSGVRSAMHVASLLHGRGPTDVDVAPIPAI